MKESVSEDVVSSSGNDLMYSDYDISLEAILCTRDGGILSDLNGDLNTRTSMSWKLAVAAATAALSGSYACGCSERALLAFQGPSLGPVSVTRRPRRLSPGGKSGVDFSTSRLLI